VQAVRFCEPPRFDQGLSPGEPVSPPMEQSSVTMQGGGSYPGRPGERIFPGEASNSPIEEFVE
jgi:hypothetical protein